MVDPDRRLAIFSPITAFAVEGNMWCASKRILAVMVVLASGGMGAAVAGVPDIGEQPACMVFAAGYQKHYLHLQYIHGNYWKHAQVFGRWSQSDGTIRPVSGAWLGLYDHWENAPRRISLSGSAGGTTCDASIDLALDLEDYTVNGTMYITCTSYGGAVQKYQGYLTSGDCFY